MYRLIAIGDIHGAASQLEEVLASIRLTQDDILIFLGDYIDRGPRIVDTLDIISSTIEEFPNTVLLMGNHEEMMLTSFGDKRLWLANGGNITVADFQAKGKEVGDYNHLWDRLVYTHKEVTEARNYYFSHAGWQPHLNLEEQYGDVTEANVWGRSHLNSPNKWTDGTAVFGHTPYVEPVVRNNMIGIDTGACFEGGRLTAVELPTRFGQELRFHHSHINKG